MYENGNVNISTEPAHSGKGPKGKVLSQYRETTRRFPLGCQQRGPRATCKFINLLTDSQDIIPKDMGRVKLKLYI